MIVKLLEYLQVDFCLGPLARESPGISYMEKVVDATGARERQRSLGLIT